MSNQQIGTVVGGIIGYFVGYPQLGLVVGSLIGAALTEGTKSEGPRLTDRRVTNSQYGQGVPTVYGTMRLGGTVADSTDKIEIPTVTESGGKGGGNETTTYQYFVHMGVVLCETPPDGSEVVVRKMWKDGKLIYDASSGMPIGSALASAESPYSFAVLYQGKEDQLPDPIEEIYHGVGNVPAYRGVVRIRLNAIECPGGRVPQFSFEIMTSGTLGKETVTFTTNTDPAGPGPTVTDLEYRGIIGATQIEHFPSIRQGGDESNGGPYFYRAYELGANYSHPDASSTTRYTSNLNFDVQVPLVGSQDAPATVWWYGVGNPQIEYHVLDQKFGLDTVIYDDVPAGGRGAITQAAYDSVSARYALKVTSGTQFLMLPEDAFSPAISAADFVGGVCYYNSELSVAYRPSSTADLRVLTMRYESGAFTTLSDVLIESPGSPSACLLFRDAGGLFVRLVRDGAIYQVNGTTVTLLATEAFGDEQTFYASSSYAIVGPFQSGGVSTYKMVRYRVAQPDEASVADIIADQCRRAGLAPDQVDVSGIEDTVWGYTIANPASARANIQPLLSAYAIDATEEDGQIKFFKRADQASIGTVSYDELGCVEAGGDPGDPMPLTRGQEAELPSSVAVSYLNPEFDYQQGTEKAIRQVTESQKDQTFDLPLATSSDRAATVAQLLLYDAWNERNMRSCKLSRKYAYLSAGRVLTVEYPRGTLADWRIKKYTDTGVLVEIDWVPADASLYGMTAIGATGYVQQQVSELEPPTDMRLLDMPILRDADNDAGFYAALEPYGPDGWRGAALLGGDSDASLQNLGSVTAGAVIGFLESITADSGEPGRIDRITQMTVSVGAGVLNSTTWDGIFAGKQNYCAIGGRGFWEILQFRIATDLGGGRYALLDFIREQRGTEAIKVAAIAQLQAGDHFVLLNTAGMLRPPMELGALNTLKRYKAVSIGRDPAGVASTEFANTGVGLKPLAVVNVRRRNVAGNIVISWDRRSRLSDNWLAGIMPLGESTERYEVVIKPSTGGTGVKRVLTTYSPSVTYLAADIAADGYSPTGSVNVEIYQMSDAVGRGIRNARAV